MNLEPIHLRHLNDAAYCPRRFKLKQVVGQFQLSLDMADGLASHQGTVRPGGEQRVYSERLGLIGRIDALRTVSGQRVLSEHKRASAPSHAHDILQLQAQALCLAEMGVQVDQLVLHDRRRHRSWSVERDDAAVEALVDTCRALLASATLPAVLTRRSLCRSCTVRDACQPECRAAEVKQ